MRFARLDARQDAQIRELLAATRDVGEISVDVQRPDPRTGTDSLGQRLGPPGQGGQLGRIVPAPVGEVDVLGERHCWQAQLHGAGAGELHRRARRGVPGPPGVNVVIGGQTGDGVHAITLVRRGHPAYPMAQLGRVVVAGVGVQPGMQLGRRATLDAAVRAADHVECQTDRGERVADTVRPSRKVSRGKASLMADMTRVINISSSWITLAS